LFHDPRPAKLNLQKIPSFGVPGSSMAVSEASSVTVREDRTAAAAARAIALLSAAAILVGLLLLARLGGSSGRDLGAGGAGAAFGDATSLLIVAEVLKLATATAQMVLAYRARPAEPFWLRALLFLAGAAAAFCIAASGLVGLQAVAVKDQGLVPTIAGFGFAGVAATGLWAILLVTSKTLPLGRWPAGAGLLFGTIAISALALPPLAMLSAVIGWFWWLSLGACFRRGS
jgi:hypothetical protein